MKIFKAVFTITLLILGAAIAQDGYSADNEKPTTLDIFQMQGSVLDKLDLSAEQKKQLDADRVKNKQDMTVLLAKMVSYREALKTELMKPQLDMKKIDKIRDDIKATQGQATDIRLDSVINVRKIMTEEQFVRFIELSDMRKGERTRRAGGARK